MPITIRPLSFHDGTAAATIFFDAVHIGAADVYTPAQCRAWAGTAPNPAGWLQKFTDIAGYAADQDGTLVGFMTLDATGYIDLAFVRPDLMGQGVGKTLYQAIEARAVADGITQLSTQASHKAKPFFANLGWQMDAAQNVMKNGVKLANFRMSKRLGEV